jgi:hypothetical protein
MLGKAQKIIVIIAIVLIVICFSMVIWSLFQAKSGPWPPISQPCPDHWKINGTSCENTSGKSIDFSSFTLCDKYKWTMGETVNGISGSTGALWDGISYGYGEHDACYAPV